MARLPFGRNPFADAEPAPSASANPPRPSPSVLANISRPPPHAISIDKQDKHRKRDTAEGTKNLQSKKLKSTAEGSLTDSVASTFGSVAAEHFSDQDIKILKGRSDTDAEFNFKIGLGDAFYHGLNVLAQKNAVIQEQDKSLKKFRNEAASFNSKLSEAQKKFDSEAKARKDDVDRLQSDLDRMKLDSENAIKLLEDENGRLRGENQELSAGMRKGQSEAYSVGFLDYLRNFLAADPGYDWSIHFAPSTPAYMLDFQAKNAEAIEAAREVLRKKIATELEVAAGGEKKEAAEGENTHVASPSETVGK